MQLAFSLESVSTQVSLCLDPAKGKKRRKGLESPYYVCVQKRKRGERKEEKKEKR
jgi:hypothetical protein